MWNRWLRSFVLLTALFVPSAACAQLLPDKAAAAFTVAEGLEMSLWASEPLFVNPTCMDIDHKGRVWVCESVNYRNKQQGKKLHRAAGDRIVILEDSKGTGKADKAITFYQSPQLLAPLGIAVAAEPSRDRKGTFSYKVYICQSPDILLLEDKNGDGKADGPPKRLLTGFGGFDHDHGVHGILLGHDGKLYFSAGDQGVRNLQSADGKGRKWTSNDSDCRAGTIWRCDLDGKNLERIAHNFHNPHEPCVDSFGTVFTSDLGDEDKPRTRLCYVMAGGDYGYHPRSPGQKLWHEEQAGVVPKILDTGIGSPAGMCPYEGTLLPKKYQGQLLHTDAGARQVRCYHLTPDGAGYAVEREDMVTSTDNWFRPSDVCVAPDGSVFIADWYDPDIGDHRMGDVSRGRIYRLAPKGNSYRVPKVDLTSNDGITAALASPALSVRAMAIARLKTLPAEEVKKILDPAIAQNNDPYLRARAFWQVYSRKGLPLTPAAIAVGRAVNEPPDPRMSPMTLRLTRDAHGVSPAHYGEILIKLIYGHSPLVRREALLQLRDADKVKAKPLIRELAMKYDGKDRFYLEAIGIAVGHHDKARRDAILADFDKLFVEWDERIGNLVWELRPPGMLPLLEARLGDAKVSAAQRAQMVDIIAAYEDKETGTILLKALQAGLPAAAREKVIDNLKLFLPGKWQYLSRSRELSAAIKGMLAQADTKETALALIGLAQKTDEVGAVAALARGKDEPEAVRFAAARTLGLLPVPAAVEALQDMLKTRPAALRTEAVLALGQLSGQKTNARVATVAMKQLQDLVRSAESNTALAQSALEALAGTFTGTKWLLDLNDNKQMPKALKDDAGRLLRNSPFQRLRKRAIIAFPPTGP
ncbi:MAG TPA: PVC-type heme-binding CxxCH protein [Gemmataceae bacterium]|nr:PVC-type heme-binding CxxCH protein [Gemmataceae bacterium]